MKNLSEAKFRAYGAIAKGMGYIERCLICNRKLKSDESKRRGFGDTCFRRVLKVAAEENARRKMKKELKRGKGSEIHGQINIFEQL